jgi:hypothetical protein
LFARASTFDANEIQPFGTSACGDPRAGLRSTVNTKSRNLGISHTHLFGRSVINEPFRWMSVKARSAKIAVSISRACRLQGVTGDPGCRFSTSLDARALQHFRDPTYHYRDNQHVELYDNVTFDRGAQVENRRLLLSSAAQTRAAGYRTRRLYTRDSS